MPSGRSVLLIGLVLGFVRTRADEFDLNVALDGEDKYTPTKAPSKPGGRGGSDDEFDLNFALDGEDKYTPTKAPSKPGGRGGSDDEFDLNVALDGEDKYTPTKAPSKPGGRGGSGHQFGDDDLLNVADDNYKPDKTNSKGRSAGGSSGGRSAGGSSGGHSSGGSSGGGGSGTLTGIISGVLLSLAGGVTSYVLYQKKKLCFKLRGNSGEQNMKQDAAQGQQVDPQSYNTLLQSQPA
ncbi:CD99 antigen-like [Narcine bancroftii]|uniref:CD99 antigen-like n=1 Tax=Narcine bancroftii TaxID=1343680 RepID=UPI003831DCD0